MAYKQYFEKETPSYGGMNTALQFSLIPPSQSPRLQNCYMDEIGDISKRPGSVPVITSALADPISHLMTYPFPQDTPAGAAPTLSAVAGAATLPADTYYVRYTYVTAEGETEASAEASQAIVLTETLRVVIPALPLHAESINIYISTTTNTETFELSTTSLSNDFTAPLFGTGVAYPTVNTTTLRNDILAVSDDTIYSFYNDALNPATMTDVLESSDVYDADFTGVNTGVLVNVKVLADGGNLKEFDGATCQDVTPATDDASPAPVNILADINTLGIKYVWVHSNYVFANCGDNQVFYSKQASQAGSDNQYDYWPETNFTILVRKGDYVNGCGIPFDDVCFIPMRQGWNVLQGTNFNDFNFGEYLNTINGVIAPRSPQVITKPNGQQSIVYLSDETVHEIYSTSLEGQTRQYSTRDIMDNKVNLSLYEFTEAEKALAKGKYIVSLNMYLLEIIRDTTPYVFGYDTRSLEWYVWHNLQINAFLEVDSMAYFAGDDGFLKTFDKDLYSDWDQAAKSSGDAVHFKRYSPALAAEFSGFASMWDAYVVESQQWYVPATLDITFIFSNNTDVMEDIVANEVFVEGVSEWGYAKYANVNFTDLVNEPNEILFDYSRLSKYVQVLWENNRNEPVKIYKDKFKGRASGR